MLARATPKRDYYCQSRSGNRLFELGLYVARGEKGGKGGTGKGGVFEKGKRYPITVEALKTRWQRDRAKAALVLPSVANIRWHNLRGTFGSRLPRKTRNPAWVQKALGHTSINTTMRHYVMCRTMMGAKRRPRCKVRRRRRPCKGCKESCKVGLIWK